MKAWMIKTPGLILLLWTCKTDPESSQGEFLEVMGELLGYNTFEQAAQEGYHCVRVEIKESK